MTLDRDTLDFPSCLSSFWLSFFFDSFRHEVQQSEKKDLAILWLVRIIWWPRGKTCILSCCSMWILSGIFAKLGSTNLRNGARHSRCTTPQRQTQIAILHHHHQCRLWTYLSAQRYCMYFRDVCRGFGARKVGRNWCVQLVAIFNSSSLPA